MEEQTNRLHNGGHQLESDAASVSGHNSSSQPATRASSTTGDQEHYPESDGQSENPLLTVVSPTRRPDSSRPTSSDPRSLREHVPSPGSTSGSTRAVTPEVVEPKSPSIDTNVGYLSRDIPSQRSSPRSIPAGGGIPGGSRRQGIVFTDDDQESSPPSRVLGGSSTRPRTRTLEQSLLNQRSMPPPEVAETRHRVGSMSSAGSQSKETRSPVHAMGSALAPTSHLDTSLTPNKDNKSHRRLINKHSSRSSSPVTSTHASIDALPVPISTSDPNKMCLLMKALCGKMKGEIEYQSETGPWYSGVAYIDGERGCLIFDSGMSGPFHIPLVYDLRGCRVLPVEYLEDGKRCVELFSLQPSVNLLLCPAAPEEFDFWLAALLCWQQAKPPMLRSGNNESINPVVQNRPELKRHGKSETKQATIIKVGNVSLWDKGPAGSARAAVRRSPTGDRRSPIPWRSVSCILHDNGDFKVFMEHDSTALATIELSQLTRGAIQQLDHSVLDEEHCIAIFPLYAASAERLSILRPVYMALESRVQFEVWFVLLRAFAVPDIYRLDDAERNEDEGGSEVEGLEDDNNKDTFRVEKMISVRVIEAKIRAPAAGVDPPRPGKGQKTGSDGLAANYLAEVVLDGNVRARTTTKVDTKNPFWREDCDFPDLPPTTPVLSVVLKKTDENVEASTHPSITQSSVTGSAAREVVCGSVELVLEELQRGVDHEKWLQIKDEAQQPIGSMLIKVSHNEHVVLLLKEYNDLSEVLHNFSNGLTTLISSVMPGQLRRLAELFLNIFQVSGSASEWFMALVEDEIDGIGQQAAVKFRYNGRLKSNESVDSASDRELIVRDMSKNLAGEANLLFRGNTLLTQSLEFHMRRLGKEFLEDTLKAKIFEINEVNPDCEIDPAKLYHAGGDLEQHWSLLVHLTTEIWQCITEAVNRIPAELRQILKYIRAVAEDRYGDFLRSVAYTSVSGFLFLRFICPAILSPKLFGLLRDHPRPRAQRTFTLITKALQKLANMSTFGKREEFMEPMNKFLIGQRNKFKEYIDQVCEIPTGQVVNTPLANYSTPITIMGRQSPLAKEGFPSLPYLIDHARAFAGLVKLWTNMNPLQDKTNPDGELIIFNDICRTLAERASACLVKAEAHRKRQSGQVNELVEILGQASLIEAMPLSYIDNSGLPGALPQPSASPHHSSIGLDEATLGSSSSDNNTHTPGAEDSSTKDAQFHHSKSKRRRSREVRKKEGFGGPSAIGFKPLSNAASALGGLAVDTGSSGSSSRVDSVGATPGSAESKEGRHIGSVKVKNVRMGKTILNGIMRIGGRAESPEGKSHR